MGGIVCAEWGWISTAGARLSCACALVLGALAVARPRLRAVAALLLTASAGALGLAWRLEEAARWHSLAGADRRVDARVCGLERSRGRVQVDLCDASNALEKGRTLPTRIRLVEREGDPAAAWLATLAPGDRVRAALRLRSPRGLANPGSGSWERALERRGVGAVARLLDPALRVRLSRAGPGGRGRAAAAVEALRGRIGARLSQYGESGGLYRALVLGERAGLAPGRRAEFVTLGIAHLLAVSGLHLALVAGAAYALLLAGLARVSRVAGSLDSRLLALAGAWLAALAYALLAGWGLPVRRAWIFLGLLVAAMVQGRRPPGVHLLALAALGLLAVEPGALFDLGAQLSFVATAGLMVSGATRGRGRAGTQSGAFARLGEALEALVRASAAALAVTAPLLASRGAEVSPAGLLANLVAVPWTAFVLLPAALTSGALCLLPEGPVSEVVLGWVLMPGEGTLAAVGWTSRGLGWALGGLGLPGAPGPGGPPLLSALVVSALLAWRALGCARTRSCVALALLASGLLVVAPRRPVVPGPPRLVCLDVGQGDACLVQGRRGALLVDGGRALPGGSDLGERVVVPAVRALGVSRLDLVIATHADLDHRGGLPAVLRRLPVSELWIPRGGARDPLFRELLGVARARGVEVRERGQGDLPARFGDLEVTPLWPRSHATPSSRNDASLVVRVEWLGGSRSGLGAAATRMLLPGDLGGAGERALLASGAPLGAEILKLGHHGSRTSSSVELLARVDPRVAIVSAPCMRRGGLPSPDALERARAQGADLGWTGRDGAVFVNLDATRGGLVARGWRDRTACPEIIPK